MKTALLPLILLASAACQSGPLTVPVEARIEIPYSESTVFGKSEGEDGAIERAFLLRDQLLVLEQRGRRLEFDMRDFPGDLFIAHQSRLTLPLSYVLPDGSALMWTKRGVRVGEIRVKEPKKGRYRWNVESGTFVERDDDS